MPSGREQRVIGSLFDRLTDENPRSSVEIPKPINDQVRDYENSVARDLANLLNNRRSDKDIPDEFPESRESLLAYGLQDLSTFPLDREAIRRSVERTVRQFEPRLSRAHVTLNDDGDHDLSFEISGVLWVGVDWEPVVFGAEMPTETRRFQVTVDQ